MEELLRTEVIMAFIESRKHITKIYKNGLDPNREDSAADLNKITENEVS